MIKDLQKTVEHVSNWIIKQAENSRAQSLVVGISGGVDSAVVAGLCAKTGIRTIGVLMPCHSSPSSISRGLEVVNTFKIAAHTVNLEKAFESIVSQVTSEGYFGLIVNEVKSDPSYLAQTGALRSCLRAPTLDFVSKLHDGIIIGTGNRDEDEVTRYFQKRGDGCIDISPIAKLHKSEVYQLAEYLGVPTSIIQAVPSADLWGPDSGQEDEKQLGMDYKEIEWGIRTAEMHSSGSTRDVAFIEAANHGGHNDRQKLVLRTLGQMEMESRHKENPNLPVCDVRAFGLGLVE